MTPRASSSTRRLASLAVVTSLALAGCSKAHHGSAQTGTSPAITSAVVAPPASAAPTSSAPVSQSPAPTSTAPAPAVSPTATPTSAATGGPVPAGFLPMSVTFVSAQTGFVLGQVPCKSTLCYGLAKTTDAGHSFTFVADLPVVPQNAQPITEVRFANLHDGWAFGPQLWATHDGGATWRQAAEPGPVSDVEAAAGVAYALVASCGTKPCIQGDRLLKTPVAQDAWSAISMQALPDGAGSIALHGSAIWVVDNGGSNGTFDTSADGTSWHRLSSPCVSAGTDLALVGVAPASTSRLFLLCAGNPAAGSESKVVLISLDGGVTTHLTPSAPANGGIAGTIAVANDSVVAVSAQSGATLIYRSPDVGLTWATPFSKGDGGRGLTDLGFTTPTQGVAIYGRPGDGAVSQLLMTRNAGATWTPVSF
jgi:hypothetical protein